MRSRKDIRPLPGQHLAAALAALFAVLATALAVAAPPAGASTLITSFSAGVLKDENVANPKESDYATQAGSHPDVAFTKFTMNTSLGSAQNVRVDLPAGMSVNPQATPRCSASGTTLNVTCAASSRVGTSTVTVANIPVIGKETISAAVYNMTPPGGAPADFAFEVTVGLLFTVRTDLVGGLRYYPSNGQPADYGEYFTISNISNLLGTALEKSELVFWGAPAEHNGGGGANNAFLTNPSTCAGPQTTHITASTYAPVTSESTSYTTPVGANGCASEPFSPTISVTPNTTKRDTPDGLGVDLHVPQDQNPAHIATSHLQNASVTLPAGLTLNPSAANGLQACSDAQFGAGTNAAVTCPGASVAGTDEITTPVLGTALTGNVYVGEPLPGNPYRVFVDAENAAAGVAVRLVGTVAADPVTGRLTTTFSNNPQVPFTDLKLAFKTGAGALFANPLACGEANTTTALTPYSGQAAATPASAFTVDSNGSGGACPAGTAFAPVAGAVPSSTTAGANTNLTFTVTRLDGEQILGSLTAKLPEGMLASLTGVTLCQEPAAAAGTCTVASKIGTVAVAAGAGTTPLSLNGNVYLTSAYGGGTFGLSIVVPAIAGPYNLGTVVVRAAVGVDTSHGVVSIDSDALPTILQGVPLRLRSLTVTINRSEFLQNPDYCTPTAITGTVVSTAAQQQPFSSAVTETGCELLGFSPTLSLTPTSTQHDSATGATLALHVAPGSAEVREAVLHLPAGVTLNPAVAKGLAACTDAQLAVGTENPIGCPASSAVGTVQISTPLLPTPLVGTLYVGQPLSQVPDSGQEYRLFLYAANASYGLSVRLVGTVAADPTTGRLTATFAQAPPIVFSELQLALKGGAGAPLAQPLTCGAAASTATLTPSTGSIAGPAIAPFTVDADGAGGACPAAAPFALTQTTEDDAAGWGAGGSFTLSLHRADGQQYLSGVTTALPPGVLGRIAAVTLCPDTAAGAGTCPESSRIGSVFTALGAGASALELPGSVYLTGPYAGAPYGLVVEVPAQAVGPFDYGTISTRARILVDERTARVTVISDPLPTIVGGVPLRLKALTVDVGNGSFLVSPTNCGRSSTETTLASTLGASQTIATPLGLSGCESLPFSPSMSAGSGAGASRALGASLHVEVNYPQGSQANLSAVSTSLPAQLPSRLSTLQKACPEGTFAADPGACPGASQVGQASVSTPLLPAPLSGTAYLVSYGGAAFPALDIVLSGDGLRLRLYGTTDIKGGITTETYSNLPDVPFSRFSLTLPEGQYSLLAANGALCGESLAISATLTAQNGKRLLQQAPIAVAGCPPGISSAGAGISRLRIAPARFAAAASGASVTAAAPPARAGRRGHHKRREAKTGATVSLVAASAGTTTFFIARPSRGEQSGKRCVPPSKGKRKGRRAKKRACTRWLRLGSFTYRARAGANSLHFSGRLRGRRLAKGAYQLQAALAGATGTPPSARFQITR